MVQGPICCFLSFQTHQPVFIQLLQSAFRIYNCTWPSPAQKASVESCIRTLAEVGKSECHILLILHFVKEIWLLVKRQYKQIFSLYLNKKAGVVSIKLKSNDQQMILNVTYFWGEGNIIIPFLFKI